MPSSAARGQFINLAQPPASYLVPGPDCFNRISGEFIGLPVYTVTIPWRCPEWNKNIDTLLQCRASLKTDWGWVCGSDDMWEKGYWHSMHDDDAGGITPTWISVSCLHSLIPWRGTFQWHQPEWWQSSHKVTKTNTSTHKTTTDRVLHESNFVFHGIDFPELLTLRISLSLTTQDNVFFVWTEYQTVIGVYAQPRPHSW